MIRHTLPRTAALTLVTLGLVCACAPAAREGIPDPLTATLTGLQQRHAAHAVGIVRGYHFFSGPAALTRFRNSPVSLIPLSPDLEAAVTRAHEEYLAGRRAPLTPQAIQERWALLDRYVGGIKQRGFGALIRVETTDAKEAEFNFIDVPAGRWLLVAAVDTPLSAAYWAVPVEVQAGQSHLQNLLETNIWLEGLK